MFVTDSEVEMMEHQDKSQSYDISSVIGQFQWWSWDNINYDVLWKSLTWQYQLHYVRNIAFMYLAFSHK